MKYSLKELRARLNETQAETAQAVGVSEQSYRAWEKEGVYSVSLGKVIKLAEHFGVKLEDINFN